MSLLGFFLLVLSSAGCKDDVQTDIFKGPVDYVNPYMGNISHLLIPTFPTVHLPNSMLRMCPVRTDYTSQLMDGLPLFADLSSRSKCFSSQSVEPPAGFHPRSCELYL